MDHKQTNILDLMLRPDQIWEMSSFTINEKYPCVGSGHCVLHNVKLMIMSVHTSEYKEKK